MGALRFSRTYLISTLVILGTEILIALFVRDHFIRPYFGDTLALILVYCTIKIVVPAKKLEITGVALLFAFSIEILQATHFLAFIGLDQNRIAQIILGNSFSWGDMIAYLCGAILIVIFDYLIPKQCTAKTY